MSPSARISGSLISIEVDHVSLFARAEELLGDILEPLQIVAASGDRALFVARDKVLKRQVALRVHLEPDSIGRTWFERETQLLASLDHPVLRPAYSAGYRENWAYRVTKWIVGESLDDAVARGARPLPAVLQLARDLTGALEYVHSQHIVIRRIIPATVMIQHSGRAVLTDLRYANVNADIAIPGDLPAAIPFLAPEVRDGGAGEPGSDIYTVGALLYFATTGSAPSENPDEIASPKTLRHACPQVLERIIVRALQREPRGRYFTAIEMLEDLMSDLGEYDISLPVALERLATEDRAEWEKHLRRALGDDYELLHELGSGGFGRVYLVRDLALEREVALKVLHPHLTIDPAVVERFRREARIAAQLVHPHLVDVYDTGGRAGLLWYVMEYVRGKSLDRIVTLDGPMPLDRVLRFLYEGLDGLALAHGRDLVHRDLKPENLLIEDATGSLCITDFGLVLALGGGDRFGGASSRSGTPAFAAPEQLLGEVTDARADIYSLTLCAYFALIGRAPFAGGSVEAILAQQSVGQLPRLSDFRDDVPDSVIHVLETGAARDPADRFESVTQYTEALRAAERSPSGILRRLRPKWRR